METITLVNGNGRPYQIGIPRVCIIADQINDTALAHIKENTGLAFVRTNWACEVHYVAHPEASTQVMSLLMTYNFKSKYCDNRDIKNTLFLKFYQQEDFTYTGF